MMQVIECIFQLILIQFSTYVDICETSVKIEEQKTVLSKAKKKNDTKSVKKFSTQMKQK
jgi:hypothetical protein